MRVQSREEEGDSVQGRDGGRVSEEGRGCSTQKTIILLRYKGVREKRKKVTVRRHFSPVENVSEE